MKKFFTFIFAMLTIVSANAIDKISKKATYIGEITSLEGLKSADKFYLLNENDKIIQTHGGGNYWDLVVSDPATTASKKTNECGARFTLVAVDENYLMQVYHVDGSAYKYWDGEGFVNAQPTGNVIFALSGAAPKYGQDGQDLALWTPAYESNGFTFHNVGRDIYLGSDGSAARPSTEKKYWKAYANFTYDWVEAEVMSAYNAVNGEKMLAATQTALTAAYNAYDGTSAALDVLANAVNDAIDSNTKFDVTIGQDITSILSNSHFNTNDVSAWNMNGKASPYVDVINHDCEFFEKDFDMSMTLTGMKKGTYEIGMQAFQRPAGANAAAAQAYDEDNWESIATLYTTAMEVPVPNIMKEKQTTGVYGTDGAYPNDSKFDYNANTYYVPNSMAGARKWFDADYYKTTATAVVTEDGGNLTFGFKGKNITGGWILFDNFTLKYISETALVDPAESDKLLSNLPTGKMGTEAKTAMDDAATALAADKTNAELYQDLQDAIATATKTIEAYDALNTAIANFPDRSAAFPGKTFTYASEAQAMYADATANLTDVQAKTDNFLNQYRTYVKDIAGTYGKVLATKGARDGWVNIDDAKNKQNYNNPGNNDITGNTMYENYKSGGLSVGDIKQTVNVPNGKYFLRMVSFTRNSINNNDYIYIKSGSAQENSVSTGNPTSNGGSPNAFVNITNPIEVTNGQVEIGLHVGSKADWAAIGGVELLAYSITDYDRTTAKDAYGTICLPYAFTTTDATIYSAAVNGDEVELTEVTTPVAGTPYIYKATTANPTFTYVSGDIEASPVAAAPLVGVFADTTVPVGSYVLQTQSGEQKFYVVAGALTLSANKAYLTAPSSARELNIAEEATGIKAVNALVNGDAKIYDINGRELNSLQKGINIVNGVKVLVK